MIRVAFTLIGGKSWTGGYNYLLNLVRVLALYGGGRITPVLFFGTDVDESEAAPFVETPGAEVVRSALLNRQRKFRSLALALLGRDGGVASLLQEHRIDVLFESAQFFGWRVGVPALAWIPDFQHRCLRRLFSTVGYWRREFGFRAQVLGWRTIMLSSEDSRQACESFYPATRGRTHVVRFAVQPIAMETARARSIADSYGLPARFFFLPNQFWQHKNHLLVIEALAILRQRGVRVVVAASGKQEDPRDPAHFPKVRDQLEAHGLSDDFRLLGLVPYEHLHALMQCCSALLNPSLFEGWSTTVEEARALGVPMILSDLAVHREQAGDTATYFDRNDPMSLARVLETFPAQDAVAMAGRTRAAASHAQERLQRFAENFTSVVQHCKESHR